MCGRLTHCPKRLCKLPRTLPAPSQVCKCALLPWCGCWRHRVLVAPHHEFLLHHSACRTQDGHEPGAIEHHHVHEISSRWPLSVTESRGPLCIAMSGGIGLPHDPHDAWLQQEDVPSLVLTYTCRLMDRQLISSGVHSSSKVFVECILQHVHRWC